MVNLIDKDNVTVGELEKAGQLAIVVNTNEDLKGQVQNINKIIGEEGGIDLNKKVIFILPKSQKDNLDAWKNKDFPLYFNNNHYFGLHYVDVDGELNIEKVKKKLGNQDFSDSAFDKSVEYDFIKNKNAAKEDIEKVIKRVNVGGVMADNFKEFANLLDNEHKNSIAKQKSEAEGSKAKKSRINNLEILQEGLNQKDLSTKGYEKTLKKLLDKEKFPTINPLENFHNSLINAIKFTEINTTEAQNSGKTKKASTIELNEDSRVRFLTLDDNKNYIGLHVKSSYECNGNNLIITLNEVEKHGLAEYAGFKNGDTITFNQDDTTDQTTFHIINELRKGNLLGGIIKRGKDNLEFNSFQEKIDQVRYDSEITTVDSVSRKILAAQEQAKEILTTFTKEKEIEKVISGLANSSTFSKEGASELGMTQIIADAKATLDKAEDSLKAELENLKIQNKSLLSEVEEGKKLEAQSVVAGVMARTALNTAIKEAQAAQETQSEQAKAAEAAVEEERAKVTDLQAKLAAALAATEARATEAEAAEAARKAEEERLAAAAAEAAREAEEERLAAEAAEATRKAEEERLAAAEARAKEAEARETAAAEAARLAKEGGQEYYEAVAIAEIVGAFKKVVTINSSGTNYNRDAEVTLRERLDTNFTFSKDVKLEGEVDILTMITNCQEKSGSIRDQKKNEDLRLKLEEALKEMQEKKLRMILQVN